MYKLKVICYFRWLDKILENRLNELEATTVCLDTLLLALKLKWLVFIIIIISCLLLFFLVMAVLYCRRYVNLFVSNLLNKDV